MKTRSTFSIVIALLLSIAAVTFAQTANDSIKVKTTKQARLTDKDQKQSKDQVKDKTKDAVKEQKKDKIKDQTKDATKDQVKNQNASQDRNMIQSLVNEKNRDQFKASLTEEQVKLLENTEMTRAERKTAFMNSLSDEQKALLKQQYKDQSKNTNGTGSENKAKNQTKSQQKAQAKDQSNINSGSQQKHMQQMQKVGKGSGNKN